MFIIYSMDKEAAQLIAVGGLCRGTASKGVPMKSSGTRKLCMVYATVSHSSTSILGPGKDLAILMNQRPCSCRECSFKQAYTLPTLGGLNRSSYIQQTSGRAAEAPEHLLSAQVVGVVLILLLLRHFSSRG